MLLDGIAFQRDPLSFLRQRRLSDPVLQFRAGPASFSLILAPELVHRVLVTERERFGEGKWTRRAARYLGDCLITREGSVHRERRQVLQPLFSRRRMADLTERVSRRAEQWVGECAAGRPECCRVLMGELATVLTCDALWEFDVRGSRYKARKISEAVGVLVDALPNPMLSRPRAFLARQRLRRLSREMKGGPFSTALREAGCSEKEIVRETVAMLVAGVETTPQTLSRLWLELSRNPSYEKRLHQEVDAAWEEHQLQPDRLVELEFLQRLITETLRLCPPVRFIDRRPLQDMEFGGVRLAKDSNLLICVLLAHRDGAVFDQPDAFLPDRWLHTEDLAPYSFFPFGAGAHRCIGEGLARLVVPTAIAQIARKWHVDCDESTASEVEKDTKFSALLRPRAV